MSNCSPPNPLQALQAMTCTRKLNYYADYKQIEDMSHYASGASLGDVYVDETQTFRPSCSSMIGNVDYYAILNPKSERYIDSAPNLYAKVGTQAAGLQVPAPFSSMGQEYKNSYFMDEDTPGCGQSFYTQAGFVPGRFEEPATIVDPKALWASVQDNPYLLNALMVPGVIYTYTASFPESRNAGRAISNYLVGEPDSITRLTIAEEFLEPLNPQTPYLHNPGDFITPAMQPFATLLMQNQATTVSGNYFESVAPDVGANVGVPAGYTKNYLDNKARWAAWTQFNAGQLSGMEQLNQASMNGDLQFATQRALMTKPRGAYFSGPISESLGSGPEVSDTAEMSFYKAPVPRSNFVNQRNFSSVNFYP